MPGCSGQPVLNVFRVFVVVRVLVRVRMVMPVRSCMVVVMRVFMKMLLFQFVHAYRHLSYFVFYKILRRIVSLPGG